MTDHEFRGSNERCGIWERGKINYSTSQGYKLNGRSCVAVHYSCVQDGAAFHELFVDWHFSFENSESDGRLIPWRFIYLLFSSELRTFED